MPFSTGRCHDHSTFPSSLLIPYRGHAGPYALSRASVGRKDAAGPRGSARGVGLRRGPRNAPPRTRSATVPISSARFRGVSPILHAVRRELPPFRRFRRPGCHLPGPCSGRLLPAFQRRKTAGGAAGEALVPRQQGGARGGPETRRPEQGRGQRPSALSPARGPSPGDAPPCLPRKALWAAIVSLS